MSADGLEWRASEWINRRRDEAVVPREWLHFLSPTLLPCRSVTLQGSANPRTPGSEDMRIKSCVFLPAAGRRGQLVILIFSESGVCGLADPCTLGPTHTTDSIITEFFCPPPSSISIHKQENLWSLVCTVLKYYGGLHLFRSPFSF